MDSKHYVKKTIKKLIVDDCVCKDQVQILEETKKFYQSLFGNKDEHLTDVNFDNLFKDININQLNDTEKQSIETLITLEEISKSLLQDEQQSYCWFRWFPG